jgi:hypothetical protein
MAAPGFVAVSADGTFATTGLQWEGFIRIAWRALCAVGYVTPPFYEGVEYEELGVPSCRVRVTVLAHPGHPEWADLSMELLCFRAAEAVESAALMVLHTLSPPTDRRRCFRHRWGWFHLWTPTILCG